MNVRGGTLIVYTYLTCIRTLVFIWLKWVAFSCPFLVFNKHKKYLSIFVFAFMGSFYTSLKAALVFIW